MCWIIKQYISLSYTVLDDRKKTSKNVNTDVKLRHISFIYFCLHTFNNINSVNKGQRTIDEFTGTM